MSRKNRQAKTPPSATDPGASSEALHPTRTPPHILHQEIHQELHTGPIPQPEVLAEYDKVVPHLAENIVQWATDEQKHRHLMEKEYLALAKSESKASIFDGRLGQIFGFLLALVGFGTAGWFAYLGFAWAGATIFGGTLLGVVWCFIFGSKVKAEDSFRQMNEVLQSSTHAGGASIPSKGQSPRSSLSED